MTRLRLGWEFQADYDFFLCRARPPEQMGSADVLNLCLARADLDVGADHEARSDRVDQLDRADGAPSMEEADSHLSNGRDDC